MAFSESKRRGGAGLRPFGKETDVTTKKSIRPKRRVVGNVVIEDFTDIIAGKPRKSGTKLKPCPKCGAKPILAMYIDGPGIACANFERDDDKRCDMKAFPWDIDQQELAEAMWNRLPSPFILR